MTQPTLSNEQWPEVVAVHNEASDTVTDAEKLDFIYAVAKEAKELIDRTGPQIEPLVAAIEKSPLLKMFVKK